MQNNEIEKEKAASLKESGMRTFNVYKHPTLGYEAVKVGLCWPALPLNLFWFAYKKLWAAVLVWLILFFIQSIFDDAYLYFISVPMSFFILLYPMYICNRWVEVRLSKQGYNLVDTVKAKSANAAVGFASTKHALFTTPKL